MKHLKNISILILVWVLLYFVFAFLSWNIFLIKDIINAIPESESARFAFLSWIAINCYVFFCVSFEKPNKK